MATGSERPRLFALAIPLLGVLAAVQGSAPNIASTALVSLSRDLTMASGTIALAASIQALMIAATVITTGLLADRLGRRQVLLTALAVSAMGSLISSIAPVSAVYLVGQAVIGVGLGAVYGSAFGYIRSVSMPGRLAADLGVFSAVMGAASLVFTFVGAALVAVNWRLGFLVTVAVSLSCFLLVPFVLPLQQRVSGASFDIVGQLLLAVGIIAFLYGLSQLARSLTAASTLIPLAGGVVLIGLFFGFEARRSDHGAFYPVRLFRSPVFIAAVLAGFIYNFGTAVSFLQTMNLWQYVTGVSTREIAFWQIPLVAARVIGALMFGRLMSKGLSNRNAILFGSLITMVGFISLALARDATAFIDFLPGMVLVGAGVVAVSIPFGNLFIKEAPPAQFGPVTSSRTTIGQFWYSIGFAMATVIVDKMTMGGVIDRLTAVGVQPDMIGTATTSVTQYLSDGAQPSTALAREAIQDAVQSYSQAFGLMMLITAVLVFGASIIAFILLKGEKRSRSSAEASTHVARD